MRREGVGSRGLESGHSCVLNMSDVSREIIGKRMESAPQRKGWCGPIGVTRCSGERKQDHSVLYQPYPEVIVVLRIDIRGNCGRWGDVLGERPAPAPRDGRREGKKEANGELTQGQRTG